VTSDVTERPADATPARVTPRGLPPALADVDRCLVMGVLNVTPDSFSDGGSFLDTDAAVAHGVEMAAQGADIVDVGGESTRPGAHRVDAAEEVRRALPVVRSLVAAGIPVSIDTMRASTASAALEAGACLVNDVSGGLADPDMAHVVADSHAPFVAMHWRGHSVDMAERAVYDDVVADVIAELQARVDDLDRRGVDRDRVIVDPGLGFAKNSAHNWTLLARLQELNVLGRPLLVGPSRKGFLGPLLADAAGRPRPAQGRDHATTALSALIAAAGAWAVRVHDVAATADAVRVVAAVRSAESRG
jgi:dihydropteroate synthase